MTCGKVYFDSSLFLHLTNGDNAEFQALVLMHYFELREWIPIKEQSISKKKNNAQNSSKWYRRKTIANKLSFYYFTHIVSLHKIGK